MLTYSTDPHRLDVDAIHRWLSTDAYWALGRSRDVVVRAIEHSLNVGAYTDDGVLVGYARVVTDRSTFAWLCDVYVDPAARGEGVGVALVETALTELDALGVRRTLLATKDAHGLYARFGFTRPDPERYLERRPVVN